MWSFSDTVATFHAAMTLEDRTQFHTYLELLHTLCPHPPPPIYPFLGHRAKFSSNLISKVAIASGLEITGSMDKYPVSSPFDL